MKRLTMCVDEYVYYSNDGKPMIPMEILDTPYVREILKRLSEYEDTGLTPEEIQLKLLNKNISKNRSSEIPTNKLNCKHQMDYYEDECSKCDGLKDCRVEECEHLGND